MIENNSQIVPAAEVETEFTGRATYSPEDNKLRLYIGRVPRDEYLKLRAEGWTALHKQREAGGGDFAATWTPTRRDTALAYAGIIEDEDQGPAERAADRAERFGDYRDKRTSEATGHADRFDAGPSAHGYQSQARAERAAARHDRVAGRAVDAWGKAEYWQRRTAGVISHALYKSTPGVRMGRIKTIEAELRKTTASLEQYAKLWKDFQKLAAIADPDEQTKAVRAYLGRHNVYSDYMHPRQETITNEYIKERANDLYPLSTLTEREYGTSDITGAEACALFFSNHSEPSTENDWTQHYQLRLAYENQMIEAQGGRAAFIEMMPGGKIAGKLIVKVNKSPATGRVVSVFVKGLRIEGWAYRVKNVTGADYSLHQIETERLPENAYTEPTAESLAELAALNAERKAATQKSKAALPPCPLINPTDADAERLQTLLNHRAQAKLDDYDQKRFQPATVCRLTQAQYSANSKGSFARAKTRAIGHLGEEQRENYNAPVITTLCQVRGTGADSNFYIAGHFRLIVITDKPQKPLPAAVWVAAPPATVETTTSAKSYAGKDARGLSYSVNV